MPKFFFKDQFFSNIFTFSSVIRKHFEYNLRIFANFRVKLKNLWFHFCLFKKLQFFLIYFLIKIILFTLKIYFYNERRPKYRQNPVFSNIFTFLSVIHRNYEYNLKIFANFRVKTQKSTDFAYTFSKNYSFYFGFFKKDYTFYTKILFPTTKDAQSFVKIALHKMIF